jgi:hypothetical protein
MGRTIWMDAALLAAGVTFICFLVAKALSVLMFGA